VEHGDVVVVVSGGEDALAWDAEQAGEFPQGAAFAEVSVGEAEIDTVAMVADIAVHGGLPVDDLADGVELGIAAGYDAAFAKVAHEEFGLGLCVHVGSHLIEEAGVLFHEVVMGLARAAVPAPEVCPLLEPTGLHQLALADDEEVWLHEDAVLGEALHRLAETTSGIDDPGGTATAELAEHFPQGRMEGEIAAVIHEGAIEVEAEQEAGCGFGHGRSAVVEVG
jgi:hypothetical protein